MTLWRGDGPPILASQSTARQLVLAGAGIPFDIVPATIDERTIEHESGLLAPGEVAKHLAVEKARFVSILHPSRHVIGADQTLALGERRFSKPVDLARAAEHLKALAGQTHTLHSAVTVVRNGKVLFAHVATAHMTMRALSPAAIEGYLEAVGEAALGSVGAYQLEGLGAHLFSRIEGDHFTILGMPLLPLLAFFRDAKLLAF
jgi:septum formation protein